MAANNGESLISSELIAQISAILPDVGAAAFLLLLGWLLARVLAALTSRGIDAVYRVLRRIRPATQRGGGMASPHAVSRLVYWVTLIVFIGLAAETLGIEVIGRWLDDTVAYLPRLLAGIAIVVAGFVGGEFARELAARGTAAANISHSDMAGRVSQFTVVAVALVVGADQAGIDVSLLHGMLIVAAAAALGALALSFALASPHHVDNYMSARYLRRHFNEGDTIRLGEYRGRITEITPHAVILETEEGELHIPALQFTRQATLKIIRETGDA